jgi:hypothetical protein
LAELEERGFDWDLGYRPNSIGEFLLALIHPPLVAFSVLQLVSEPVWSPVGFNRLCDLKATWRKVMSSLWSLMTRISITGKIELATISEARVAPFGRSSRRRT